MSCRRCGVDGLELIGGWCRDCIEVEGYAPLGEEAKLEIRGKSVRVIDPANRLVKRKGTGDEVRSIRSHGERLTADQRSTIAQLSHAGKTTKEIALMIGCSSRSVRTYRENARGNRVAS